MKWILSPYLTAEVLDKRLQKDFDLYSKETIGYNGMKDLLPVNLIPYVIKLAELDPNKPINQITKKERFAFMSCITAYDINR